MIGPTTEASHSRTQGSRLRLLTALWAVTMIAAVTGWMSQNRVTIPLINDEAVELIQGTGMPLDRFYFFTPDTAYPGGNADIIESFYAYIVRFTLTTDKRSDAQADELRPVRNLFFAGYAAGCIVFAWAVGQSWGAGWAAAAGTALATSSFLLVVNHTVTRNGLSIIWACLIFAILWRWIRRSEGNTSAGGWSSACWLAVLLVMGCWTYTSFRLVAVAVYAALMIDWWCAGRTKHYGICVVGSGLLFAVVLLGLVAWNSDSLLIFLQRGGYAVESGGGYFARLALTLLTPFYHPNNSWTPFLIEDVHVLVDGPVLSRWLAGFFVIGWVAVWCRYRRLERVIALIWTVGMALCAVAGPNFKYLLPFLPFTLLLAMSGLKIVVEYLSAKYRRPKVWRTIAATVVIGAAWGGLHDFFHRYPNNRQNKGNLVATVLADVAADRVRAGATRVLVQPGRGVDVLNWRVRGLIASGKVSVYADIESLFAGIDADGALPSGSLLLFDYPVETLLKNPDADNLPATLKIINVRLLQEF
jgi:hypothetical protein